MATTPKSSFFRRGDDKTDISPKPDKRSSRDDSGGDRPARAPRGESTSGGGDRPADRRFSRGDGDRPARAPRRESTSGGGDRPADRRFSRGDGDRPARRPAGRESPDSDQRRGVPDWVKTSAPKSGAVRKEKKDIEVALRIEDQKVVAQQRERISVRKQQQELASESVTLKVDKPLSGLVRLNRFVAQSGVCSRREADELISQGLVIVNGVVVTELGSKVDPSIDIIEYNGKRLSGEKLVYILMNKPKGYVTSVEDPHNDLTVLTLLGDKVSQRVYPVGRLDKNTTGVLLLTNDGDLTSQLTHPSFEHRKIYHVFLDTSFSSEHLEMLANGIELEDGEIHADEISYVEGNKKEVGIELHSGRNRIVRRMFEHLGYRVLRLDRVFFAGFTKSGLRRGYWRHLNPKELMGLKGGKFR